MLAWLRYEDTMGKNRSQLRAALLVLLADFAALAIVMARAALFCVYAGPYFSLKNAQQHGTRDHAWWQQRARAAAQALQERAVDDTWLEGLLSGQVVQSVWGYTEPCGNHVQVEATQLDAMETVRELFLSLPADPGPENDRHPMAPRYRLFVRGILALFCQRVATALLRFCDKDPDGCKGAAPTNADGESLIGRYQLELLRAPNGSPYRHGGKVALGLLRKAWLPMLCERFGPLCGGDFERVLAAQSASLRYQAPSFTKQK